MNAELSWEAAVKRMQDDPARIDLVRESYYDRDVLEAASRFERGEEWGATRQLLPSKPGIAVDLGAGRGIASYALVQAGWSVIAIEPDAGNTVGRGAIGQLRERGNSKIEVLPGTAEAILLGDATADLVYARAVLHHTSDMRKACREVARVLKPGGRFLAVREHVVDHPEDEAIFLSGHELHALYGGERAWPLATYLEAIEQSGLRLIKVLGSYESSINYAPYTVRDLWGICARPLIRLVGWRLAYMLAGPESGMGRWLLRVQGKKLSALDARPGRLYSFVAVKPCARRRGE
jgi:ubiquinone/menaquinone biosynthesis C-methylase UbiE